MESGKKWNDFVESVKSFVAEEKEIAEHEGEYFDAYDTVKTQYRADMPEAIFEQLIDEVFTSNNI